MKKHCIWCGHDVDSLTTVESDAGYEAKICDSCLVEYSDWIDHVK